LFEEKETSQKWRKGMKIAKREIDSIKPYEGNPRINDKAVEAVAASIREFGFRQPIVVDEDGVIVCGHTRYLAALELKLKTVPVHVATDLTPEQIRAYRIADNKTAELAEWDYELLPIELGELQGMDFDLESLGFSSEELEKMLGAEINGNAGLTDPDAVPEPPDDPVTQPGDLWILGDHRLLCGDSSKAEDLDRLLDGAKIQLVNTDPPYNVKVEPRSNNAIAAGNSSFKQTHHQKMDLARHPEKAKATHRKMRAKDRPLENDFVSDEDFDVMLRAWFGNISRVLEPGRGFYIWGGYANCANYPSALKESELYFSQAVIWVKEHPVLTRKDFMGNHEWCFYGWREGAAHWFNPEIKNAVDVWSVKKINPQSMVHLTEKPAELAVRAMTFSSKPGENVLDHFGGSGSTLIGAEQTGRKAFLMELDQAYCDVIVKRFEEFTGKKAERIPAEVTE
jgi:DNA modification methylase